MIEILGRSKSVPIPCGLVSTLRSLEMGESVIIPTSRKSSVHPAAKRAGIRVTVRTLENGTVRVWRVPFASTTDFESSSGAPRNVFDRGTPALEATMAAPTSTPTPKPTALGPATDSLPGVWPQIVCTVGDPVKGHPEGYYIQENRYSSRIWIQGRPPTTAPAPAAETPTPAPEAKTPTPGPKKTIFD